MEIKSILQSTDIAKLDAELLLAHIFQKDRTWLTTHADEQISDEQKKMFEELVERRKSNEPVAYIIGTKEFYGRDFIVTTAVLIPRPATETLIDITLTTLKNPQESITEADTDIVISVQLLKDSLSDVKTVVDVGTGSGCIGITLALERPDLRIIATDISADALAIARKNAEKHQATDRITFKEGSFLDPIKNLQEPFLVVSNPPYIPQEEKLMPDVADFEPRSALFSGKDGFSAVREISRQAKEHPCCRGVVLEHRKQN